MLMMAALLQLISRCPVASAAFFSRGRKACRGWDLRHHHPLPPCSQCLGQGLPVSCVLTWLVCRGPMVLVV